jgi:peptidoglycan hydrolase CwlO-like protein
VWVVANLHYSRVLKQIAPLEGQLNKLKGELTESQDRLNQCQEELIALDEQVDTRSKLCSRAKVV